MFDILRTKEIYYKIILAALPLMAVCRDAKSALIGALATIITVVLAALFVNLAKPLLSKKTAAFAHLVFGVGVIGVFSAIFSIFLKATIEEITLYLPLIAVTATFLADTNFAVENSVLTTVTGSLLTSATSGAFLFVSGVIREFLGMGSLFGLDIYTKWFTPMDFFKTSAGALAVAATLTVIYNLLVKAWGKGDKE